MTNKEKLKEVGTKIANVAKNQVTGHWSLNLPKWLSWILIGVTLVGITYGTIQQFRVWRYSRILKAAKVRMIELETEKSTAKWKVAKKLAAEVEDQDKEKLKDIDEKINKLKKVKEKIDKDVNRMKPSDLLNAFKEEGF